MSIPNTYQTVNTFKFPSLVIKVYFSIEDRLTDLSKQAELFNTTREKINATIKPNEPVSPTSFEFIVDNIRSIDETRIKKIELLNPTTNNGFIFDF